MMTTIPRRVRRLRVAAGDVGEARHLRVILEDALQTASLPGGDAGRVVVVRRLDIGTVDPRISSAGLALRIEARWRELASSAIHAGSPDAPFASAVFFCDIHEAFHEFGRRLARGVPAPEWYWPLIVKPPDRPAAPALAWRGLISAWLQYPGAVPELASWISESAAFPTFAGWLEEFEEQDAREWIAACRWRHGRPDGTGTVQPSASASLPAPPEPLRRLLAAWGGQSGRALWLRGMLAVAGQPSRAGDPGLLLKLGGPSVPDFNRLNGGASLTASLADAAAEFAETEQPREPARTIARVAGSDDSTSAVGAPAGTPAGPALGPAWVTSRGQAPAEVVSNGAGVSRIADRSREPAFTQGAGLLFLLPALARLGLPDFLEQEGDLPGPAFVARLLVLAAGRTGLPVHDPILAALRLSGDMPLAASLPEEPSRSWLGALRRWCRLEAGIGLHTLIRRDGRVMATRTHLDVFFSLDAVDLKVRRAGLDLDPGWIPWFGRVVLFHYGRQWPE